MALSDWAQIAALLYGIHKSNQAPNFYTAPPTPTEQWKTDALKNLFNYTSEFTDQYLNGISNLNPDFRLNTDAVGNPAFMGGIHVPTFDTSKMHKPTANATNNNTTAPGPQGNPNDGVTGDPFGHMGAPAGTSGDPFGNLPDQTNSKTISNWDDIKSLGSAAFNFAMSLNSAGMPFGAIVATIKRVFADQLPTPKPNDVSADNLRPSGIVFPPEQTMPREHIPDQTNAQRSGNAFINSQNIGLGNLGWTAPEGQGQNQPGFGYGLPYNAFYGGDGSSEWNAPNPSSPFRRSSVGQKV